jgi:L-2,4-diaminobutyric acid acetyltransferase
MLKNLTTSSSEVRGQNFHFRKPVPADGVAVHELISKSPPLDQNSVYCYLLQCTHFAETCVAATHMDSLAGFTSAFLLPDRKDTLFIWQIVVAEPARGRGLAKKMLLELINRPRCSKVRNLETSIIPGNTSSWNLFHSLAKSLNAGCSESILFDSEKHFHGKHPEEHLLRISSSHGPFSNNFQHNSEYQL